MGKEDLEKGPEVNFAEFVLIFFSNLNFEKSKYFVYQKSTFKEGDSLSHHLCHLALADNSSSIESLSRSSEAIKSKLVGMSIFPGMIG